MGVNSANWLALSSLEEKQSIGIVKVSDAPVSTVDQRFYWGVEDPKDLDVLKAYWTAVKKASERLSETDDSSGRKQCCCSC